MKDSKFNAVQDSFSDFDFSEKPEKSALDHLVQVELLGKTEDYETQNGMFVPLPFQTGIGKTHTAVNAIVEELLDVVQQLTNDEKAKGKTVYYITNSVDNVKQTYEELLSRIASQKIGSRKRFSEKQAQLIQDRILYLPRQDVQLLDTKNHYVEQILEAFNLNNDAIISNDWRKLKNLVAHANSHKEAATALAGTLSDIASKLYSLITDKIQARQRSSSPVTINNELQLCLEQLYPGDKLRRNEANVAFMTTHKFLYGYQTLVNRCKPIRNLSGALLIVDEIDRQNEVILQVMIEQKSIDLIRAIRSLNVNLQEHRLEKSPRYEGIEEIIEPLKENLRSFANQWNLQHAFDTEGDTFLDDAVRLFSDRSFTHVNSASHYLCLDSQSSRQKNVIKSSNKKQIEHTNTQWLLSQFVNRADQIFQQFLKSMRQAVWLYWRNIDNLPTSQKESRTADGTFQEAVSSILIHYNLEQFSSAVFDAFDAHIPDTQSKNKQAHQDIILSKRSYHERGFKLVDIGLNEGTRDTVNCQFTGLPMSPSGLLVNIVNSGARILGISATANAETVVRNFDFEYLKERLGHKFVSLSAEQKSCVQDYYKSRRNYSENHVSVIAEFLNENTAHLDTAISSHLGKTARKPGLALQSWLNTDTNEGFVRLWVSKLLQSIERFISFGDNRYMLALTNRTINSIKHPDFIAFLESNIDNWSKQYHTKTTLYTGIDAAAMKEGAYLEILDKLSSNPSKIIVLSTYASMGEGKNPDYKVLDKTEAEKLIWVGEGPKPKDIRSDIDCLYLEKPTNLLIEHSSPTQRRLALFHQVLSLQERGYISPNETTKWIRSILKNENRLKSLERYYKTEDYDAAIRKLVEQAAGRMARTAFKRPNIRIFSDSAMLDTFATDHRAPELFSHEYNALVKQAESQSSKDPSQYRDKRRQVNLAKRNNKDTNSLILELVKRLHTSHTKEDIERWNLMRQEVLKHPTSNEQRESIPRFYLQTPSSDGYRYEGVIDGDNPFNFRFFDEAAKGEWVSESDCSLPTIISNNVINQHFKKNGYATHWLNQCWMLTPTAYNNIYKGALGEESALALLKHFGIDISGVEGSIFERFDFIAQLPSSSVPVGIDAKHWRMEQTLDNHKSKATFVEKQTGIKHFAYINLIGGDQECYRYLDSNLKECSIHDASVFEISGLINGATGETHTNSILALIDWMGSLQ